MRRKQREIDLCAKCLCIKPSYRDFVGSSWQVCECDKKPLAMKTPVPTITQGQTDNKPNVFTELFKSK